MIIIEEFEDTKAKG